MNGIDLTLSEEKSKLPIGASKFFGNPDVWAEFEWPQFSESGESYDLTFICQINCAEVAAFDKENVLPKSGILYFFYDMDEMPQEADGEGAARIIYYNGESTSLCEMLRIDHEGNDLSLREMKLHFHPSGVDPKQLRARLCESFTQGWQPVLQIYSFETDKVSIRFSDEKALCFFADKDRLERRVFSKILVRQVEAR